MQADAEREAFCAFRKGLCRRCLRRSGEPVLLGAIRVQYSRWSHVHGESKVDAVASVGGGLSGFRPLGNLRIKRRTDPSLQCWAAREGHEAAADPRPGPALGRGCAVSISDPCVRAGGQDSSGFAPATVLLLLRPDWPQEPAHLL